MLEIELRSATGHTSTLPTVLSLCLEKEKPSCGGSNNACFYFTYSPTLLTQGTWGGIRDTRMGTVCLQELPAVGRKQTGKYNRACVQCYFRVNVVMRAQEKRH